MILLRRIFSDREEESLKDGRGRKIKSATAGIGTGIGVGAGSVYAINKVTNKARNKVDNLTESHIKKYKAARDSKESAIFNKADKLINKIEKEYPDTKDPARVKNKIRVTKAEKNLVLKESRKAKSKIYIAHSASDKLKAKILRKGKIGTGLAIVGAAASGVGAGIAANRKFKKIEK